MKNIKSINRKLIVFICLGLFIILPISTIIFSFNIKSTLPQTSEPNFGSDNKYKNKIMYNIGTRSDRSYVNVQEEWNKTFGGSNEDNSYSVQQTSDKGYIIAGTTCSYGAGDNDVWLIKTDFSGNELWNRTFGGNQEDKGFSLQSTSDGGFIITGYTESYCIGTDNIDVWLIKTNSSGNEQWHKTFGGSKRDNGYSVHQTSDNGYIIAGYTFSYGAGDVDVWLIKTDSLGSEQWNKTFGGSYNDAGLSVQQTSDLGYVIVGETHSYGAGYEDVWLIKTDSNGNEQWNKTFGGKENETSYSVQQTSDGGYVIAGETWSYAAGWNDAWLIKTNSTGIEQWNKTFGDTNEDQVWSVQQTSDGGYIITGWTESFGAGNDDAWLIKTDSSGNKQWDKTFGGYEGDLTFSGIQTSDGGYIITGETWSFGAGFHDVWLIKVNETVSNQPPIANVGPDQNVTVNQTVYFDGSGSSDPENDTLTYNWTFGDGTSTGWQSSSKASHSYNKIGNYTVTLNVSDGSLWDTDTCIISVLKAPQLADSPWPKFRGNLRNTGLSTYDASKNAGKVIWKFEAGDRIGHSSPAIGSDGTIYFGGYDKRIYAITSEGLVKWWVELDNIISSSPAISSDGTIYIGTNYLYALNSYGQVKWKYHPDSTIDSSPTISRDGTIYFGTGNYLYALNWNGTLKWKYETGVIYHSSPAVGLDGTIYIGALNYIYAIHPNGTLNWMYKTKSNSGYCSPSIGLDGTVYISSNDEYLYALTPNGSLKWRFNDSCSYASSPAIGPDGTIYNSGTRSGNFYAIKPDGSIKWKISADIRTSSPAIGANGTIFVGSEDNILYAIYPNGTIKWKFKIEKWIQSSPAIGSDGTIYVGSLDWFLYAIGGNLSIENRPPIAVAGPDQNVTVNQTAYFDGSDSSDPDSEPITYKWAFGDGTETDWLNESKASHSYNKVGTYTVTLTVRDVTHPPLLTGTDTCTVRVLDFKENQLPVANAGPDQNITVGELINFDGSESYDPDSIIISYEWTSSIDGKLGLGKIIQNIGLSEGIHTVTLLVSDGELTDTDTCIVRVSNISGNLPPVARIRPLKNVRVSETVRLSGGDSYDEDGYVTQFHWDFGDGSESGWINVSTIEHNWDNIGTYTITLIVMDDDGATGSISYDISVTKPDWDGNGDGNDTDGDGLPNAWELEFGFDPFDPSDANLDTDGDTLTNHEEYILGTNPTKFDTDGDGVIDSSDAFPLDKAASVDTDEDGYPDSWNPGMSEKDSTTGLKLDAYPHDPNRHVKEVTSANYLFLIVLITCVLITLLILAAIKLLIKKPKHQRETQIYLDDEMLSKVRHKILQGEPLTEMEYSQDEISKMLERKFNTGQISDETYHSIKSEILGSEEGQINQPNNSNQ